MKKKLLILIPILLIILYVIYLLVPKTKTFSKDVSGLESLEINTAFGSTSYQITSQDEDIFTGEVVYTNNKPTFGNESNKYSIQGQKAKSTSLTIPNNIESALNLSAGAGNYKILLKNTMVKDLTINSGAGNIYIEVPSKESSKMNINLGAGNLEIGVPETIEGIRIVPAGGSTLDFSSGAYELVDGGYQSVNYAQANIRVELVLSVGTANFSIKSL